MKGVSKYYLNAAFRELFLSLCMRHSIAPDDLTVSIRILDKEQMIFQVCRKGIFSCEISPSEWLNGKLVALRFGPSILQQLFRVVHNAFMMETKCANPLSICLVFYLSEKANCPCIGILHGEKTLKALRITDIIEATELESEQLN